MKHILIFSILALLLSSCNENKIKELESKNRELESELNEANEKIQEYESKFDEILSKASDGYDAISYFNWSYQLQDALDAFEEIQDEASY